VAANSSIEWTGHTWNPTTGCTKVSPGCDHCYAESFVHRLSRIPNGYFSTGFDLTLRPAMLDKPRSWKRPSKIFVNSMSDLFHKDVPNDYLDQVFAVMESVDRHIYQVLTKRPERMRRYIKARYGAGKCPAHIWLGSSVENNDYAWRSLMLAEINCDVRFLSVEPMLGAVDAVPLRGIRWVIAGGESGPGYRPLDVAWVRHLRDRCASSGIAFFFKQWHKGNTGRLLDGRTWDEYPALNSQNAVGCAGTV
jgi:protein gp37